MLAGLVDVYLVLEVGTHYDNVLKRGNNDVSVQLHLVRQRQTPDLPGQVPRGVDGKIPEADPLRLSSFLPKGLS